MKSFKTLLTLLLCISSFVRSTAQTDLYRQTADSLFQYLNKSGASTGILYDRVFPIASLHEFNHNQPDTSSMAHFIQSFSEIHRAAYSSLAFVDVQGLKDRITAQKFQQKIPLGMLQTG